MHVKISVSATAATAQMIGGRIVSGMVGLKANVTFDRSWDGLAPMLVCSGGGKAVPMVVGADGWAEIPGECIRAKSELKVGFVGVSADGLTVVPTLWASLGVVPASAKDAELQPPVPPTPDIVDQIAAQAYQAALNAAIAQEIARKAEGGDFDGVSPTVSVTDTGTDYLVVITDRTGEHRFSVPKGDSVKPEAIAQAVADYFRAHPISYPVNSVNGKTGAVALTARDVGARAADWMPTAQEVGALPVDTVIPPDLTQEVAAAQAKAEQAEAIARGRATGYVFDTYTDMTAWVAAHRDELVLGDNLYIRATGSPDYWWDGSQPQILETEKVDLSGYAKTEDVPKKLSQLTGDSQHRTVSDEEKAAWNDKYTKPATGIPATDLAAGVIPTKLPTPNKLTFTGAATGEFDGSSPLSIEIPQGGGGHEFVYHDIVDFVTTEATAKIMIPVSEEAIELFRNSNIFYSNISGSDIKSNYSLKFGGYAKWNTLIQNPIIFSLNNVNSSNVFNITTLYEKATAYPYAFTNTYIFRNDAFRQSQNYLQDLRLAYFDPTKFSGPFVLESNVEIPANTRIKVVVGEVVDNANI